MRRDPNCTRCPLHATAQFVCLLGQGPIPCDIVILGEAPGEREDDSGKPFVGRAGRLLDSCLERANASREDVYITNVVHCRPPGNRTPKAQEIRACQHWLTHELSRVKPKYILLLGATALFGALGLKGLKKYRGTVIKNNGITYKVTYHPAYALRNEKAIPIIEEDIVQFFKLANQEKAEEVTYKLIKPGNIDKVVDWIFSNCDGIALDCETTSLDPFDPKSKIVSIGLSNGVDQWILLLNHSEAALPKSIATVLVHRIMRALDGCMVIGHNIKFDLLYIAKKYGKLIPAYFDTMLAFHIIDENKSLELKNILSRVFDNFVDYNVPDFEKHGEGNIHTHCQYLAKDCYYTYHLKQYICMIEFNEVKARLFHQLIMPVSNMYTRSELHGVYLDPEKYNKALAHYTDLRDQYLYNMEEWACGKIQNWNSPQQLGKLLFEDLKLPIIHCTPKGKPSTAEATLLDLAEIHGLPKLIIDYRGAIKNLQFLASWKELTDEKGFIHPRFKIAGTVTGRPSCENPNLQQTPREIIMRCCIGAPPGYILIEIDYSQIELRLTADAANEPRMRYCFVNGIDIHTYVAQTVMGISNPNKDERKKAKAVDFGFIYGMKEDHFQEYAWQKFGLRLTIEECEEKRNGFFNEFKLLLKWHKKQRATAKALGYVSTWTGRQRHLPHAQDYEDYSYEVGEALRQAINSPIQGGASELTLAAAIEIDRKYRDQVIIVGTIHDALLFYMKKEDIDTLLPEIYNIMIEPELLKVFNKEFTVPLDVEIKVGNWGIGTVYEQSSPKSRT